MLLRDVLLSDVSTILQRMLFMAARRCVLMGRGGRCCKSGTSILRPILRATTRDCGDGQETNLGCEMTWRDILLSDRKTGRCCWERRRWFDPGLRGLVRGCRVDGRGRPSLHR